MKIVAAAGAAILSMSPTLSAAVDGNHGLPIETTEQAAAAVSAPLILNPAFSNGGEAIPTFAGQTARRIRTAASAINPDPGATIPPTVVPCANGGSFTIEATPGAELSVQALYQGCRVALAGTLSVQETNGLVVARFRTDDRITLSQLGTSDQPYTEGFFNPDTNALDFQNTATLVVSGVLLENGPDPVQPFVHVADGSLREEFFNNPTADSAFITTLTGLQYSGTLFNGADVVGRDAALQGTMDFRQLVRDKTGNVLGDETFTVQSTGISVVDETTPDPQTGGVIRTLAWNGSFNLSNPDFPPSCGDGDFEVQTRTPIRSVVASGALAATDGRMRVNQHAEVLFAADQSVTLKFKGPTQFDSFSSLQDASGGCGPALQ